MELSEDFFEAVKEIHKYGLATIRDFLFKKKGKLHNFPLKTLKGYQKNLKISKLADLFRKSVIFRKRNLPECN